MQHKRENKSETRRRHYKSPLASQRGIDDMNKAKQHLSNFGYKLCEKESKRKLQFSVEMGVVYVWQCKTSYEDWEECPDFQCFDVESRYPCKVHGPWGIQCAHELAKDGCLCLDTFKIWWMNKKIYREENPGPPPVLTKV
jgi:hypothetical protein